MSIVNPTYFKGSINLPKGENTQLQGIIDDYEKVIVRKLFGYELGKLILAYTVGSDQRIKDIVEGKEYTVSYNGRDQTIKWNGLANVDLISLISYYCYCMRQKELLTINGNLGVSKPVQQNADVASPQYTEVQSWRAMYELYGNPCNDELDPTAYNFMTKFIDVYPEWVYFDIGNKNTRGL